MSNNITEAMHVVWEKLLLDLELEYDPGAGLRSDAEWFDTEDGSFTRRALEATGRRVVDARSRVVAVHSLLTDGRG